MARSEPVYQPDVHGTSHFARWARSVIYATPPVRWLIKSKLGHHITYMIRLSQKVKHPLSFVVGEMGPAGLEALELRSSGKKVYVRRRSADLMMFHQLIGRDVYKPPIEVAERLDRIEGPLCFADLGANVGFFTIRMLEHFPDSQSFAVEADPENAAVFSRTIDANHLGGQIELSQAAASNHTGTVEFATGESWRGRVVDDDGPGTVTVPLVDVLPSLKDRHLLKIDIEGSEWSILADERFRDLDATALTMEWHEFRCPSDDPRAAAEKALVEAGYTVRHGVAADGCGTLWAWR